MCVWLAVGVIFVAVTYYLKRTAINPFTVVCCVLAACPFVVWWAWLYLHAGGRHVDDVRYAPIVLILAVELCATGWIFWRLRSRR